MEIGSGWLSHVINFAMDKGPILKQIIHHPLFRFAVAYAIFDVVLAGIGMGVPFFCILAGFVIGWYLPSAPSTTKTRQGLRGSIVLAVAVAMFTVFVMFVIWSPAIAQAMDPAFDYEGFGIPQILFDPVASYIGWMLLMIVVSPILQMLTMVFSASLREAFFTPAP